LNVEPPVFSRIGWVVSRRSVICAHAGLDLGRVVGRAFEHGVQHDGRLAVLQGAVAIGVVQVFDRQFTHLASAVHDAHGLDDIDGLGAVAAGVHDHRAADGAGDAGVELQPRDARVGRLAGQDGVGHGAAGLDAIGAQGFDGVEALAQADHHALDAAVADQQVRAHPDGHHRHGRVQGFQEVRQVLLVGRQEHHVGRTADPEPGERRQGLVDQQLAANGGELGFPGHGSDRCS
jgi:hypothetical protein